MADRDENSALIALAELRNLEADRVAAEEAKRRAKEDAERKAREERRGDEGRSMFRQHGGLAPCESDGFPEPQPDFASGSRLVSDFGRAVAVHPRNNAADGNLTV